MKKLLFFIVAASLVLALVAAGCIPTSPTVPETGNEAPVAYIDSISPAEAFYGETVTCTGHGTDSDGSVVAYRWRSSIDGDIGTAASFPTSSLSGGTHTIYLKVQDNSGDWSAEVSATVAVVTAEAPPAGEADLVVTNIFKVETDDGYIIGYTLENQGDGDAAASTSKLYVDGVETTGDSLPAIAAGVSVDRNFVSWIYDPTTPVIKVVTDVDDDVAESDEGNNEKQVSMAVETVYDFIDNAPDANWQSGPPITTLSFGGATNDSNGFVTYRTDKRLEDGTGPIEVLETHPRWVTDGWIRGAYAEQYYQGYTVEPGEHFVARVGFLEGASAGSVTFLVEINQEVTGNKTIVLLTKSYGTPIETIDIPLTDYIGERSSFTLEVLTNGSSAQDWAVWIEAKIIR